MPKHSHDNPKQSKNNLMLLYSYLSLLPYILRLPQINSENKPSLSKDALINVMIFSLQSFTGCFKKAYKVDQA